MARKVPSLGEFETRVLQLVWEHEPCTERQLFELARQQRNVGRTTVLKTLQRLETKGLLIRESGRPAKYRAAFKEGHVLAELVARFVDGVLGGSSQPLVAYLAGQKHISIQDIQALKRIAAKITDDPSGPSAE